MLEYYRSITSCCQNCLRKEASTQTDLFPTSSTWDQFNIASNSAKKVPISNAHLAIRWQSYKLQASVMTFIACSSFAYLNQHVLVNIISTPLNQQVFVISVSPSGHYRIVLCGSNKVSCVQTMNSSISFTLFSCPRTSILLLHIYDFKLLAKKWRLKN